MKLYFIIMFTFLFISCVSEDDTFTSSNDSATTVLSDLDSHDYHNIDDNNIVPEPDEVPDTSTNYPDTSTTNNDTHQDPVDDIPAIDTNNEMPDETVMPNNQCRSDGPNGYIYTCYQQGGGPGTWEGGCQGCSDCQYLEASGGDGGYVKSWCYTSQVMENFSPTEKYFIVCVLKEYDNGGCNVIFTIDGNRLNAEDKLYRHDDEVSWEDGTKVFCGNESHVSVNFECN